MSQEYVEEKPGLGCYGCVMIALILTTIIAAAITSISRLSEIQW